MMYNKNPATLLVIDDSPADVDLVEFCIEQLNLNLNLEVCNSGNEAFDFLFKKNEHKNAPDPDIILLDINLPDMSGIDILEQIKKDTTTRSIPVVMLTSSKQQRDIVNAYNNYANSYLQKPIDIASFQDVLKTFHSFWFSTAILPKASSI